jgi:hypothetical protein
MTIRKKWTVIPGFIALAAAATILSAYSGASSSEGRQPDQPINFPHPQHVKTLGMNCLYCHYSANKSPDPGMPAVGTCMGCHTLIGPNRPAIAAKAADSAGPAEPARPARKSEDLAKLASYWDKKQPVPWVRIHKVPDYVNFPHMRHVTAGVTCQSCHGQVQDMEKVYQKNSLNMGWCVNCHVNGYQPAEGARLAGVTPTAADLAAPPRKARYDCSSCHY